MFRFLAFQSFLAAIWGEAASVFPQLLSHPDLFYRVELGF